MTYWIAYGFVLLLSLTALVLSINPYGFEYILPSPTPIVSELRRPTGTAVIYYADGTMNAGDDFYKPWVEGNFLIAESPIHGLRIIPFIQVLEVFWFPGDSIKDAPYHQPLEPFTFPTPQQEGT